MSWQDALRLSVEVGLRGTSVPGEAVWDQTVWDQSNWSGIEPVWAPLEAVKSVRVDRGRSHALQRHTTGTATVVLEWGGPEQGQWSWRASTPVTIGQELRVRAQVLATKQWLPIYRGTVRSVADTWPHSPFQLTVHCVDRFAELAAVDLPEQSPVGAGERTDVRLRRILDLAGISRYYLKADAGLITLTSSNFARNLLDEAQVSVESEIGQFYVDRQGFLVFNGRHWFNVKPRSANEQVVWSNALNAPAAAPIVQTTTFRTSSSIDDVENYIAMARVDGTVQIVFDQKSMDAYSKRTHQRMDLVNQFSSDVAQVAAFRLSQLKQRTRRVEPLNAVLGAHLGSAGLAALAGAELGDLHRVYWDDGAVDSTDLYDSSTTYDSAVETYDGTADAMDLNFHVQGVHHSITQTQWEVGVDLWDYVGFTPTAGWDVGLWNTTTWFSG